MIDCLFNLKGKTALITGASQGLGERFAITLANAGVHVILAARNFKKLEETVHKIQEKGGSSQCIKLDVTNPKEIKSAVSSLENSGVILDILINSAGISLLTPIFENAKDKVENDESFFADTMNVNVMGVWLMTKEVANHMKNKGINGSIINVSSVCGANKLRGSLAAYCASKAAVIQMTKALVGELATAKIRINCIVPGLFHTPLTDHRVGDNNIRSEIEKTIPLGFVPNPEELDGTILYLASNNASRYVTGSCVTVDGGASWGGVYDYYVYKGVIY